MQIHFTGYRIMILFDYLNKSNIGLSTFRLDNDALFNSILGSIFAPSVEQIDNLHQTYL
jgi:hypothetical protein